MRIKISDEDESKEIVAVGDWSAEKAIEAHGMEPDNVDWEIDDTSDNS